MKEESLENFFSIASKIIIFIPVIVVVLALILKFNQKPKETTTFSSMKAVPSPTKTPVLSKIKLDLKGPFVCNSRTKEASISAFIKDKQLKVTYENKNKKENFLILGDCSYQWEKDKYSGEKICGISSFLSAIEVLGSFGGLTGEQLFNQLSNFAPQLSIATDEAAIFNLINSCRKEDFDENIFEIPKSVLFKNKEKTDF